MEIIIIPVLWVVVAINLILGLIIFSRGIKDPRNIFFGVIAFSSAFWSLSIIAFHDSNIFPNIRWLDYTHISALCVAFVFFIFSFIFPKKLFKSFNVVIVGSLLFLISCLVIAFTDYVVGDRIVETSEYILTTGYSFYSAILASYFFVGYIFLYFQYARATQIDQKQQIKYVLFGSLVASSLALVPDLVMPFFRIFDFTWLGPLFTLIMVFSIFIAMAKYHLFSVKILVTELFTGLIIFVLLVDLFLANDLTNLLIKTGIIVLVAIASFLLIRSVYREVEQREKIEKLAKDLEGANKSLEKANERLKELDQLKSEFVSLASHQLRGPLTAIKGYISEITEGDFGIVPNNLKGPIETVFKSAESLATIVEDFLNVSRIEQGRMKYEMTEFSFGELVEEVANEDRPNFTSKNLFLELVIDKAPKINADRGKIKQIINNLIDNTVKYTQKGGATITVKRTGDRVLFSLKDTGVGIKKETIPKLFQKFSRAEDASKANILGTGLGLYVAKQMIEAHGGRIWVESAGDGKGSTFFVELKTIS